MSDLPDIDGYRKMNVPYGAIFHKEYNFGPRFTKVCQITTKYNGGEMDLLDLLGQIKKPPRDLFLDIKCNMNFKTNEALVEPTVSRSDSAKRSAALKVLKSVGLVRKIRGNAFMINPAMIIPPTKEQVENATEKWEMLK